MELSGSNESDTLFELKEFTNIVTSVRIGKATLGNLCLHKSESSQDVQVGGDLEVTIVGISIECSGDINVDVKSFDSEYNLNQIIFYWEQCR